MNDDRRINGLSGGSGGGWGPASLRCQSLLGQAVEARH